MKLGPVQAIALVWMTTALMACGEQEVTPPAGTGPTTVLVTKPATREIVPAAATNVPAGTTATIPKRTATPGLTPPTPVHATATTPLSMPVPVPVPVPTPASTAEPTMESTMKQTLEATSEPGQEPTPAASTTPEPAPTRATEPVALPTHTPAPMAALEPTPTPVPTATPAPTPPAGELTPGPETPAGPTETADEADGVPGEWIEEPTIINEISVQCSWSFQMRPPEHRRPDFLKWLPDSTAFLVDADGLQNFEEELWVLDVDGLAPRKIKDFNPLYHAVNSSPFDFYGDLSPDGKQVVYSTCEFDVPRYGLDSEGNKIPWYELAIVDIDGDNTIRLTESTDYENYPSWSPDGNLIAYLWRGRSPTGPGWRGNIVVASITPSGEINEIARYGTHAASMQPVWSPDGQYLAFAEYAVHDGRAASRESVLFVAEPGNPNAEIVSLGRSFTAATWSPDSKRVAIAPVYRRYGFGSGIVIYNPDGTGGKEILRRDYGILDMDWHPDGSELLAVADRLGLLAVDVEGDRVRHLLPKDFPLVPTNASWSPDGATIAVRGWMVDNSNYHRPTGLTVMTMNREGNDIRLLATQVEEPDFRLPIVHTCPGAPAWDGTSDEGETCTSKEE